MDFSIVQTSPTDAPYDLLYEGDESHESVADYIGRGECYIAVADGETIGVMVLLHTRPFTREIVNICVQDQYRNKGVARRMIAFGIEKARNAGASVMEIGTGDCGIAQIALYCKCGFTISHIDHDYFRKHCPEPIFENGLECRHMVRMRMDL